MLCHLDVGLAPGIGYQLGVKIATTLVREARPEWVIEVGYDAMEGDRFRHTAQFKRSRPDRTPQSCTYEQLERPVRFNVDEVLAG